MVASKGLIQLFLHGSKLSELFSARGISYGLSHDFPKTVEIGGAAAFAIGTVLAVRWHSCHGSYEAAWSLAGPSDVSQMVSEMKCP